MKIKKIVTGMLILSMMFVTFSGNAYAATNSSNKDVISFEEYYSAMKDLYAKYGVTYEVLQKNENFIFTKELLNEQLKNAEKKLKENQQYSKNTYYIINLPGVSNPSTDGYVIQSVMPYDYNHTSNVLVRSPSGMGFAYFDLNLQATADAQYDTFMYINSYTCEQSGGYLNFKSWEESAKSYTLSSNKQNCRVSFDGKLTVEYTEKETGLLVGYTSKHNVSFSFSALWENN